MSDDEEENFCFFGKPLDPYDEDAFPKKRPITVEEQIATDAQGRRRFHGAFTGGFSAGFFNTVGSLEGWTPSEFKSTRQEKALQVVQKPVDFMDQEDLSEYGIAPQTVRATEEYSTSKRRRKQVFTEGPIPGKPVLETLLTTCNETIGYLLLKKLSIKDKIREREDQDSHAKNYGCQKQFKIPQKIENKQYKIPKIYTDNLITPKSNTFGLDYKGLDRSHVNLFAPSNLVIRDKNNKKFSIAGQAFGVGAFEEDDDDIYVKEDMSNYDFEMKKEDSIKKKTKTESNLVFGLFKHSNRPLIFKKLYPPPVIPHSFSGKHKVKKSRFEQIEIKTEEKEIERNQINPAIRAKYLEEETNENFTPSRPIIPKKEKPKTFDISLVMSDRFVSATQAEDVTNICEPVMKTETLHGTQDMREAARMKMFGALTRITSDWTPCAILCKRFNVPEPLSDRPEIKNRKRTKNLIFENQKFTEDDKVSFQAGVSNPTSETTPSTSKNEETPTTSIVEEATTTVEVPSTSVTEEIVIKTEDPKDIMEKIGIDENLDLFKSVFLSSSESESEEEPDNEEKKTEEFKETILTDLIPKIRPLKQGILSNITFQPKNKKPEEITTEEIAIEPKIASYGPQLPDKKITPTNSVNAINLVDSDDEWVEKNSKTKHKKSKHKKGKKKKHKHSKKKIKQMKMKEYL